MLVVNGNHVSGLGFDSKWLPVFSLSSFSFIHYDLVLYIHRHTKIYIHRHKNIQTQIYTNTQTQIYTNIYTQTQIYTDT